MLFRSNELEILILIRITGRGAKELERLGLTLGDPDPRQAHSSPSSGVARVSKEGQESAKVSERKTKKNRRSDRIQRVPNPFTLSGSGYGFSHQTQQPTPTSLKNILSNFISHFI